MKKCLLLILIFAGFYLKAEVKPTEVSSKIENVTVFLRGAQISRSGNINIEPGTTNIKFSDLSPEIDERSIKISGGGNFTVMSVMFQINYLKEQEKSIKTEELVNKREILSDKLGVENSMLAVYQQEETVLMENKKLGGSEIGVQVIELKDAVNFYRTRLTEINLKQIEVNKTIKKLNEEIGKINAQLNDLNSKQNKPTGEVLVTLYSKTSTSAKLSLTYTISQTGWHPSYDVRVKNISQPLSLIYKANVFQQSGEDWKGVKLKLSTADPSLSGVQPLLNPKYLGIYQTNYKGSVAQIGYSSPNSSVRDVRGTLTDSRGEALPGVSVVVKGSSVGTSTDVNGNYTIQIPSGSTYLVISYIGYKTQEIPISSSFINVSLMEDIASLSEVVVAGYGTSLDGRSPGVNISSDEFKIRKKEKITPIETNQINNSTSVEFDIKISYSVPTDGKHYAVEMEEYSLPAIYEYIAIPKLDKDAFLTAKIVDWESLNLLAGEANLFFEDTYVGKSLLDIQSTNDTLSLSLGRDKSISVTRTQVKNFTSRQFIGANKTETKAFEINVRNKKGLPVNLTIEDQIPISAVKEIEVQDLEISGAKMEKSTGKLTWNLKISPNESKKLNFKYEVKYPKNLRLALD